MSVLEAAGFQKHFSVERGGDGRLTFPEVYTNVKIYFYNFTKWCDA